MLVGRTLLRGFIAVIAAVTLPHVLGCPDPNTGVDGKKGPRSDKADQWFKRAADEFKALDLTEASDSIGKAAAGAPGDHEIMMLAARIHLASLDARVNATALPWGEALRAARKDVRVVNHQGVNHAFNNDTSAQRYDKAAADNAWAQTLAFFRSHLAMEPS